MGLWTPIAGPTEVPVPGRPTATCLVAANAAPVRATLVVEEGAGAPVAGLVEPEGPTGLEVAPARHVVAQALVPTPVPARLVGLRPVLDRAGPPVASTTATEVAVEARPTREAATRSPVGTGGASKCFPVVHSLKTCVFGGEPRQKWNPLVHWVCLP